MVLSITKKIRKNQMAQEIKVVAKGSSPNRIQSNHKKEEEIHQNG